MHNTVTELERSRVLNIRLDNLATGTWRAIGGDELKEFLAKIGIR